MVHILKYKCLVNILKIYILLSTNGTYLAILWKAGGKSNTLLYIRQNVNIWTNVCGDIWKLYYVASKLRKSLRDIFNCMQTHIHAGDNWQLYFVTYNLRQELTSHFQLCITGNRKMVLATVFRVMTSEKVRESFWQVGQFDKLEENFCVTFTSSVVGEQDRSIPTHAHVQSTYLSWRFARFPGVWR